MLDNTPLSRRLILIALLACLAVGLVTGSLVYIARQYDGLLDYLIEKDLPSHEAISKSYVAFSEINGELFKLLNARHDEEPSGEYYLRGRKLIDRIDGLQSTATAQNFRVPPSDMALIDTLQKSLAEYKNTAVIGLEITLANRDLQLVHSNRLAASFNRINGAFLKLMEFSRIDMTEDIHKTSNAIGHRLLLLGGIATLLVASLTGFIFWLVTRMSRQFNYVESSLKRLCQDDTTEAATPPVADPAFTSLYHALESFREALRKTYASEQALSEKNLALEHQASELAEARDLALQANQAKSRFLAGISHELRTPMNGFMGMAQLLAETPLNADQRDMLDIAIQSSRHLHRLIEDLLDFSNIEHGQLHCEKKPFDLHATVKDIAASFNDAMRAKHLAFNAVLDEGLPRRVVGDPLRLRQVLGHLLDNAIKFTEKGRVALVVTACGNTRNPALIRFTVHDSGIGISPEHQAKIFDLFSQADNSSTRQYGGMGLGLTLCHHLARLMGGAVRLENLPTEGATFHVEIPLEPVIEEPMQNQTIMPPPTRSARERRHVLVVEDNPMNRTLAKAMLNKLGHDTSFAENGREALEQLGRGTFDLIVMDCQMPVMDGFETARAIRRREAEAGSGHIPILAVTANAMTGDRERCLESGMDDYLSKPYKLEQLNEKINALLNAAPPG